MTGVVRSSAIGTYRAEHCKTRTEMPMSRMIVAVATDQIAVDMTD